MRHFKAEAGRQQQQQQQEKEGQEASNPSMLSSIAAAVTAASSVESVEADRTPSCRKKDRGDLRPSKDSPMLGPTDGGMPALSSTGTPPPAPDPAHRLQLMAAEAVSEGAAAALQEEDLALLRLFGATTATSLRNSKEAYEEAWAHFELMEMERLSPSAEIASMADEVPITLPHHNGIKDRW